MGIKTFLFSANNAVNRNLVRIENIICFSALALLAMLPMIELLLRQFNLTIPDFTLIVTHIFLVTCFFAAMYTSKSGEHISISAVQFIKSEKVKKTLFVICTLISVFILTVLFWNCVCFVTHLSGRLIGFIPNKVFIAAMPLGYGVIAVRLIIKLPGLREKISAVIVVVLGCFAALPALCKIIWGVDVMNTPEPFFTWMDNLYIFARVIKIPVIIFLITAGLAGTPIFSVIGGIVMIMLMAAVPEGHEPEVISDLIYKALNETDIIAIPLFTLTGFFLSESKAGERLVRAFKIFFGWMPGGIIIAAVVICAFFSSFTGASGVTILALGGILYTILSQNKYSERFSVGMLTSVGGIGLLFPPSLPVILVASSSVTILYYMEIPSNYNIIHYFIGALIPGILLVLAMIFTSFVLSRKVKFVPEKFESKEAVRSLKDSVFEILLPFILIIGYFSGFLTLIEVSAVSVIYVIIVEVFVKKDIPFKNIPQVFFKAAPIIGGIIAIIAMAKGLSYALLDTNVPENFALWMQSAISSKVIFLLLLNLVLLLLGCVLDIFSAILVLLPLVVPLGVAYGIDPLHLGIIFIINLEAGFLTPPVGINLFLASYRFGKPFVEICRYVAPFLLVRIVVVLLVTYLPWLSTGLVKLFT
ncbi:MAG: TRAP transporter large permease subunit [Treponema sp.]|nr:TRAP transporter large permease subunit [Treponema sp.]